VVVTSHQLRSWLLFNTRSCTIDWFCKIVVVSILDPLHLFWETILSQMTVFVLPIEFYFYDKLDLHRSVFNLMHRL